MAKKTPLPVIPLDNWFKDAKSVTELREILDTPAFQTAEATLKEVHGPHHGAISTDTTANSHRHAWYAGYRDAFADLRKLTNMQVDKTTQPVDTEWTHITTPQ